MSEKKNKGGLIKGLIIGGAIGSVMSLLLSSKKGKECRDKLSDGIGAGGKKLWECFKKEKE